MIHTQYPIWCVCFQLPSGLGISAGIRRGPCVSQISPCTCVTGLPSRWELRQTTSSAGTTRGRSQTRNARNCTQYYIPNKPSPPYHRKPRRARLPMSGDSRRSAKQKRRNPMNRILYALILAMTLAVNRPIAGADSVPAPDFTTCRDNLAIDAFLREASQTYSKMANTVELRGGYQIEDKKGVKGGQWNGGEKAIQLNPQLAGAHRASIIAFEMANAFHQPLSRRMIWQPFQVTLQRKRNSAYAKK